MTKKFLTLGKELRDSLTITKNRIWNNLDNFAFGDHRRGFKCTYACAEWHVETIYDVCDKVLDCFDTYQPYAVQVKNAFYRLGELITILNENSEIALNDTYSLFLTEIAPNDEKWYLTRDLANGEEEEYYVEPDYEDFLNNMEDCEYTYDYETWNNIEQAIFELSEDIIGYDIWNYAFNMYNALEGGEN